MACTFKDFSQRWISDMEPAFETSHVSKEDEVTFAVNLLRGRAKDWVEVLRKERRNEGGIKEERDEKRKREGVEVTPKKAKFSSPTKKVVGKPSSRQCRTSGKEHSGECRLKTTACFKCGKMGHLAHQCTSPISLCYHCYKPGHHRSDCPDLKHKETVGKKVEIPKPKGRAFQITAEEARKIPYIVACIFMINSLPALTLFDSGASRSFVSFKFANHTSFLSKRLEEPLEIEVANDRSFLVFDVYRGCKFEVDGETFPIDLIPMTMGEFDVIVERDWLSLYRANILCGPKAIQLVSPSGKTLFIRGERTSGLLLCSYLQAMRYIAHGCKAFLACVTNSNRGVVKIHDVPIVNQFVDVFPEELPEIPPGREVEFGIDLIPGANRLPRHLID
ncbi:hypothetical protein L1987_14917 [Smallanthus sonchifolius]|uniref:Uncharacterized protein n=1 Tax=Smallanthus sonchifolius TaxID=185202 RepID=A0ACB9J6P4_9ASTR|nr:hypothetical protein L1987_14917 [Smallanthus sonchifolius]